MPTAAAGEEIVHDVAVRGLGAELHVVLQYRRNNPCRSVRGGGHHAPAGSVFFINCQGEQIHPLHGAQGRSDDIGFADFQQASVQTRRAALHIQSSGQDTFMPQARVHASAHRLPDLRQPVADVFFTAPYTLIGQHQLGNT